MGDRSNAALLGALFFLAACDKSATATDNAANAGNTPVTAAVSAAPTPPAHNWSYREGQEYGYPGAISEDEQKAGQAIASVQMFRFLGTQNGVYTVARVANGAATIASCANPCQVVKLSSGGLMQRVTFNPESIVGAALTDAFNGQMEVYGSGAPVPAPQPNASPPVPATPVPAAAPSADPYAADKIAEREGDASRTPADPAASGAPTDVTTTISFRQGLVDRRDYEAWFGRLSGDYLSGATFWESHRSLAHPPMCKRSNPSLIPAWINGCQAAKQHLDASDMRRKSNPWYRLGWNSFPEPSG
ncbi:MAG: hypothetical protein M3T55_12625 [Pseudomonadota bacterium]|nr:hypothetical protein [Pseudomonadota bacterium]